MEVKIILMVVCFPIVFSLKCVPNYYYWRQHYGEKQFFDFVGANDPNGQKFVAKIIVPDKTSYTVPAEIMFDHVSFGWDDNHSQRVTQYIHVITSSYWRDIRWVHINQTTCYDGIMTDCFCLIEGGGIITNHEYNTFYIGRAQKHGRFFIGRVPSLENNETSRVMYAMDGWKAVKFIDDFEILTYPHSWW